MARLEELQRLWQSQPEPAIRAVDSRGMSAALRRFGRRQNLIYSVKAALVVSLIWVCLSRVGLSALAVIGAAVLACGLLAMVLTDWRAQLGIARLDFGKPSAAFVDSVIERLRDPNAALRRRLWLHMAPAAAGINLLMAGRWAGSPPRVRIAAHLAMTVVPVAAYALGLKLRSARCSAEYRPIVERLAAMKMALEERTQ